MKMKDILLEYNREITLRNSRTNLVKAFHNGPDWHMFNDAGEDAESQDRLAMQVLQELEKGDPTPNQQYVPWIVREYSARRIRRLEDVITRIRPALVLYHANKNKPAVPASMRDIGRIQANQLEDLSSTLLPPEPKDKKAERGSFEIVADTPEVRVIIPKDVAAACYYGRGTRWCTAARENNMFERYNSNGPLYIFLPKQPEYDGEKYQIHFESDQFMNEGDDPVSIIHIFNRFPTQRSLFESKMQVIHRKTPLIVLTPDQTLNEFSKLISQGLHTYYNIALNHFFDRYIEDDPDSWDEYFADEMQRRGISTEEIDTMTHLQLVYDFIREVDSGAARLLSCVDRAANEITGELIKNIMLNAGMDHEDRYNCETVISIPEALACYYEDTQSTRDYKLVIHFFRNLLALNSYTGNVLHNVGKVDIPNSKTMYIFICDDEILPTGRRWR